MKLRMGEQVIIIDDCEKSSSIISKHTGKELDKVTLTLSVQYSYSKEFEELLKTFKDGGIFDETDENNIKEYKLTNRSYSYSNNSSPYKYTLTIEQIEKFYISSLSICGFDIIPYEYSEKYDRGIIINTKWKLCDNDKEQLKSLINNQQYFQVIRNGISEDPIAMRFGRVLWSEIDGGIKQDVVLVEKVYDDVSENSHGLFQPELSNIMHILAYTTNLNNELINLLVSKELITPIDLEDIKEKAKQGEDKTYNKFYKVKDIDTY